MQARPQSFPRQVGRQALALLLCVAWLTACGESAPDGPRRMVVVQRDISWAAVPPEEPPLSLDVHWDFAKGMGPWSTHAEQTAIEGRELILQGAGSVELAGPWTGYRVDTELQHRLTLDLATQGVQQMTIFWRLPGEIFDATRRFILPLTDSDIPQRLVFRLNTLKSALNASDAAEGFSELQLRFEATEDDEPITVRVAGIGLESDFELPPGAHHLELPLERRGVRLSGACLRIPGSLGTTMEIGAGERLRLALAVAGRGCDATVTLRDSSGELPVVTTLLTNGSPWRWLEVDLSPLAGREVQLHLDVDGDPGVLLVGGMVRMAPRPDELPNIVLYIVDTLRADHLGSYGYGPPTDPVLSAFAEQGVRVRQVVAASNWTRPSITSLLTGVGPEVHGNQRPGERIPEDLPTLAESLQAQGYLTVSFVTNHHAGSWSGLDRGFDVQHEPRHFPRSQPETTLTSQLVDRPLQRLLEQHTDERLFIYIHTLDPHGPYAPSEEDLLAVQVGGAARPVFSVDDPERRAALEDNALRYDAEILHNDRWLGRLDEALQRQGLAENTLIAFLSDHGEGFFEHGERAHWRTLYEEEVAVPWVLRWPAGLPAGRVLEGPAAHVDLAPTLLGLLGVPAPDAWTGWDLSALMSGDSADAGQISEADLNSRVCLIDAVINTRLLPGPERRLVAARRGSLKLITQVGPSGRPEPVGQFDLAQDPLEQRDLLEGAGPDRELLAAIVEFLAVDAERARHVTTDGDTSVDAERLQWLREMGYLK